MNTRIIRWFFGLCIVWAFAIALDKFDLAAHASGVVTPCDAAQFQNALASGGTVTFNCAPPANIYLNSQIVITTTATVDGTNGGNTVSIIPVNDTRAFSVTNGVALTLTNLNLYDGFDSNGGCIYTNGALVLDNVQIINCMAGTSTRGGAIYVNSTGRARIANSQVLSNTAYHSGGAIYSLGTLTVTNSYFRHNRLPHVNSPNSTIDGGAIWASGNTRIDSSTFYTNTAADGFGGAIYNQGVLNVTNSDIISNTVQKGGGGIQTYLGTTTLQNVKVLSNTVTEYQSANGGGGLMNSQGTLTLTNVTIQGNKGNFGGGGIRNDGNATLVNVYINGNNAEYAGGIRNGGNALLNFTNGTVNNNSAYETGGIYNLNNGTITLSNLAISGNTSQSYGGGVYNQETALLTNMTITGNTASYGGGIAGVVTLLNSAVSGNTAYNGGGIWGGGYIYKSTVSGNTASNGGGGIYSGGTTNIVNSTISGNRAYNDGGGIYFNSGSTGLFNVTITNNRANYNNTDSNVGGGVANAGGILNFKNSIIAKNRNAISGAPPTLFYDDCYGILTSQGNNIMYDTSGCTVVGSVTLTDPLIGGLQNNGGSTQTHALLANSPALDAGDPAGCKDNNSVLLATDQRGYLRPFPIGGRCDIGAYEFGWTLLLPIIRK